MNIPLIKLLGFVFIFLSTVAAQANSNPALLLYKKKVLVKQDIDLGSDFTDLFSEVWTEEKNIKYRHELSAWLGHKKPKKNDGTLKAGTILDVKDVYVDDDGLFISFKKSNVRTLVMKHKVDFYVNESSVECSSYWESPETSLFMAPYEVKHCYPASGFKTLYQAIPLETIIQRLEPWIEFISEQASL